MPHSRGQAKRKLSRKSAQRRALLKSLAYQLIMHESIVTTKPKAKALVPFVERLITKSKRQTLHSRRLVAKRLGNTEAVTKLHDELLPRFQSRQSGHIRIKPAGYRRGDLAPLATMSLILDEVKPPAGRQTQPKTAKPAPKAKPAAKAGAKK